MGWWSARRSDSEQAGLNGAANRRWETDQRKGGRSGQSELRLAGRIQRVETNCTCFVFQGSCASSKRGKDKRDFSMSDLPVSFLFAIMFVSALIGCA